MHMELPAPFEGWTLTDNGLWSPNGVRWTTIDLDRWHWDRQLLALLKRRQTQPAQYLLEID